MKWQPPSYSPYQVEEASPVIGNGPSPEHRPETRQDLLVERVLPTTG
jgi:hypothetical protein